MQVLLSEGQRVIDAHLPEVGSQGPRVPLKRWRNKCPHKRPIDSHGKPISLSGIDLASATRVGVAAWSGTRIDIYWASLTYSLSKGGGLDRNSTMEASRLGMELTSWDSEDAVKT